MKMHECASTLIRSYGYDEKARDLDIAFHSGGTWRYSGVPMDVFLEFLRSASKGKFLNASIKPKFTAEKI